jgi:4-hydroxy-tetrahydrodipicolinate synthase
MQAHCLAGDYAAALKIQDALMPLHKAIFTEPGLVGVKYAMSRLGLCAPDVRLPLVPLTDATKALVDNGLRHAGLIS